MAEGEIAFSHALCQKACLQVIYAQAEHRAEAQSKIIHSGQFPKSGARQPRPPTPAGAVHIVEKVTDALADVVSAYISQVAKGSLSRARHAGRSKTCLYDVLNTLNGMSFLTHSSVRDIAQYLTMRQIQFPVHVPIFPVLSSVSPSTSIVPSIAQTKPTSSSSLKDVPTDDTQAKRMRTFVEPWMPDIPSAYTFVTNPGILAPLDRTSTVSGPEQRRRVEASLARLREAGAHSTSIPHSQSQSQSTAMSNAHPSNSSSTTTMTTGNPFMTLPRILSGSTQGEGGDGDGGASDPSRLPLEVEDTNVESNTVVVETKYSISDQKKARVDRILAESGTVMISAGAGTGGNNTTTNATAIDASTPAPSTPAGGGAASSQGKN